MMASFADDKNVDDSASDAKCGLTLGLHCLTTGPIAQHTAPAEHTTMALLANENSSADGALDAKSTLTTPVSPQRNATLACASDATST